MSASTKQPLTATEVTTGALAGRQGLHPGRGAAQERRQFPKFAYGLLSRSTELPCNAWLATVSPTSLLYHLEVEGIAVDSIKHSVLTHAHGARFGGLLEPGTDELAFGNVQVYMGRVEYECWTVDPVRPVFSLNGRWCEGGVTLRYVLSEMVKWSNSQTASIRISGSLIP